MSTAYLLMDYVPWHTGASKPALLAWEEHGRLLVHGVGVSPGAPFDPVAFAGVFPGEVDVAWVFAEWAAAVQDVRQFGGGLALVRALLDAAPEGAVQLRAAGVAPAPAPLLAQLPAGTIARKGVALAALTYLLRSEALPDVTPLKDRVLVGAHTLTVQRQEDDWRVLGRGPTTRRATTITMLSETACRAKLRAWWAAQGT